MLQDSGRVIFLSTDLRKFRGSRGSGNSSSGERPRPSSRTRTYMMCTTQPLITCVFNTFSLLKLSRKLYTSERSLFSPSIYLTMHACFGVRRPYVRTRTFHAGRRSFIRYEAEGTNSSPRSDFGPPPERKSSLSLVDAPTSYSKNGRADEGALSSGTCSQLPSFLPSRSLVATRQPTAESSLARW